MSQAGQLLKSFLKQRYKTVKIFCRQNRLKEPYLSQVIKGKRKPNFQLLNRLEELGFDVNVFDSEIKLENYLGTDTASDYQSIVAELKRIIQSKNLIIRGLEMLNRNLQNEINKKRNCQKLTSS